MPGLQGPTGIEGALVGVTLTLFRFASTSQINVLHD